MRKLFKTGLIIIFLLIYIQPALAEQQINSVNYYDHNENRTRLVFMKIDASEASDDSKKLNRINLYFFYGDGCPHCAKEEKFLDKLEKEYQNIKIFRYEIYQDSKNRQLFTEVGRALQIKRSGVPLLIVGEEHFVGFANEQTTGVKIEQAINDHLQHGCQDLVGPILGIKPEPQEDDQEECAQIGGLPDKITVPFIGTINPQQFSLPILTIVLAAIDGFNPCAMWVLLFLINLLLSMANRRKMWILGSAFIIASAAVYFIFLAAWLNLVLFMGLVTWLRVIIALVALFSGGIHLYDYYTRKGCKTEDSEKRKKVFDKLRRIILEEKFYLALIGIIILAGIVNLVELLCSAGIPAVYVPILTLANLPTWHYYLYLLLYIFIFLLDDLLVFVIAMKTLHIKVISTRFTHWSGLVGGIIMLIIGILLLFKPSWLMFG